MLERLKTFIFQNKFISLFGLLILINFSLILLIVLTNITHPAIETTSDKLNKEEIVSLYEAYRIEKLVNTAYNQMTEEEKIGQLFMVSISGTTMYQNTKTLIQDYKVGGVILMSENIASQNQIRQLINSMNEGTDLLIATDQEGGVVARVPWDEARYISQPHIGIVAREDFAYEVGTQHAQALKNLGIDMNLAPVLDASFISNSAMSSRTLGASPQKVASLGVQIIKAHQDQEIIPCVKHFPGIGRTTSDTHNTLPTIDIQREQLISEELVPFKAAIEQDVEAVMIGHAMYPQLDSNHPSSLSKIIITDLLRNELEFNGVVITDDIAMKALANYPNRVVEAINAGADIILIVDTYQNEANYITQIREAVERGEISGERIEESVKRILRLKYKYSV